MFLVMVYYIDGADFIGIYDDYLKASKEVDNLKKYKKSFGVDETYKIYNVCWAYLLWQNE